MTNFEKYKDSIFENCKDSIRNISLEIYAIKRRLERVHGSGEVQKTRLVEDCNGQCGKVRKEVENGMKEIKLTVDGKEINLTAEQIKALGIDVDDGCVCDRVEYGEYYYFIGNGGTVHKIMESNAPLDCEIYDYGNYYRDKSYAKQVALHQKLNNLLRRYSEQHGGDKEWDGLNHNFSIIFDFGEKNFYVGSYTRSKQCGVVYFGSLSVAENAIEEVVKPFMAENPEFVW